MPGSKERQRRRARERYERQRAECLSRRRKVRRWAGIVLAIIVVAGLIAALSLAFTGGSPKSSAAAKPSASPSASPDAASVTEPATATASRTLSCSSSPVGTGGPGYMFAGENLQSSLPPSYTPFGAINSGLDILQNVAKARTSCGYSADGGMPKEKIFIKSVAVRKL